MLPDLIVHADWGTDPKKRVACVARLQPDGAYRIDATQRVGQHGSPRERLGVPVDATKVLIGFDFPIGVPAAYADRAGISAFRDALGQFGTGEWNDFFRVCETAAEIGVHRPFYPQRPGGTKFEHLEHGLGLTRAELYRRCERRTTSRNAACPLFWTLGGNQVGKAAISGWREFVQPIVWEGDHAALWPFDGSLIDLLRTRSCVIAETYPAEFYNQLSLRLSGSKRSQLIRKELGPQLLAVTEGLSAEVVNEARHEITEGFGAGADGEDRFDAMIGLLGMLKHLRADTQVEPPDDETILSVEGWMLGQSF